MKKYIAEHTDRFADMDSINSEFVDGDVDYLEGGDEQFAKEIKEKLAEVAMLRAKLICKKAVHVALLIVCTLLAWLILTILKKIFAGLADWSVIGWANKLGGFIVGTCEALLILIILSRVFDIAGIELLNDLSDGTYVLNWITNGDINAALHELKTLDIQGLRQIELKELKNIDYSNIASQVRRLFSVQK